MDYKRQVKNPRGGFPIRIKWNSIHGKLLATYLGVTAMGTSLLAGYLLWSFHAFFLNTKRAELDAWTPAISESVAEALEQSDRQRAEALVKRYGAAEAVTLRVFGPDGRLLATSAPQTDGQIADWLAVPGIREALENKTVRGVAKGVLSNDDRLYEVRPLYRNGRRIGVLRISLTLAQFQRQFQTLIWTVLGTVLVTFSLCACVSVWFARSIATPIQAMRNFAIRLGGGHLGDKLNIPQNDELGDLATELNRMSERLAALERERRAFLANVSHELRTPVSNVSVTLEALSSGAGEEQQLRERFIQTAIEETARLSRLIKDLLELGRLEAGVMPLEQQPVSLQQLLNRCVLAMEPRMRAASVGIHLDVPDVELKGDPERLLQAFLNVLDNAIKYSAPDSEVFVSGRVEGAFVAVQIRDWGGGISEADFPHIFEQFYTADRSRKGSGTGLGLAIAQRIVEAHGGKIAASSTAGKGATFTIRLPSHPPARPAAGNS